MDIFTPTGDSGQLLDSPPTETLAPEPDTTKDATDQTPPKPNMKRCLKKYPTRCIHST